MRTRQRLVLLCVLPTNRAADTCTGRPIRWQHRQPNRPLSNSPVKTTIQSARPVCSPAGQAVRSASKPFRTYISISFWKDWLEKIRLFWLKLLLLSPFLSSCSNLNRFVAGRAIVACSLICWVVSLCSGSGWDISFCSWFVLLVCGYFLGVMGRLLIERGRMWWGGGQA